MMAVSIHINNMSVLDETDLETVSGGIAPVVVALGAGFLKGVEIAAAGYAAYLAYGLVMDYMTNE